MLSVLAGGDENTSKDVGAFISMLLRLRNYLGCSILVIHHAGKDEDRGARGWSGLKAAVDTEVHVKKEEGGVSVATVTKQRDMVGGETIPFALKLVRLGFDQDGDEVTSCVVEAAEYTPEPAELSGRARDALDVLAQTVTEAGELIPVGGEMIRAVRLDRWREAMRSSGRFGEGNALRQSWSWARGKLGDQGHVQFADGCAWPTPAPPF